MFLNRIAFTFSKHHHLVIPYYNKGFKHPIENEFATQISKEYLKIENPQGFIYAFNNLIASINHEDFIEFANKTCDTQLVKAFSTGINRLKENNQFIEPIYDSEIEEEVILSEPTFCFDLNSSTSYYDQNPLIRFSLLNGRFEVYNAFGKLMKDMSKILQINPDLSVLMECYIKCKTSLKIQQFDLHPYNYHIVKFQLVKTSDKSTYLEKLTSVFKGDMSKMILGDEYRWKIINIDNFLKK